MFFVLTERSILYHSHCSIISSIYLTFLWNLLIKDRSCASCFLLIFHFFEAVRSFTILLFLPFTDLQFLTQSLFLSLSHTHTLSLSLFLSLFLFISLSLSLTHTLSLSSSLSLSFSSSLLFSLSLSLSIYLSLTLSLTLSLHLSSSFLIFSLHDQFKEVPKWSHFVFLYFAVVAEERDLTRFFK